MSAVGKTFSTEHCRQISASDDLSVCNSQVSQAASERSSPASVAVEAEKGPTINEQPSGSSIAFRPRADRNSVTVANRVFGAGPTALDDQGCLEEDVLGTGDTSITHTKLHRKFRKRASS